MVDLKLYPANHQLGARVPAGGSRCENCMFYKMKQTCGNKGFIAWDGSQSPNPKPAGSDQIPVKADSYCCDLWA